MPFTTIKPEDLWAVFHRGKIFKGCGNNLEPRMVRQDRLRATDFDLRLSAKNGFVEVHPNPTMGLSLSATVERIERLNLEGTIWELQEPHLLPAGLTIHYEDLEHPLLNVTKIMMEVEAIVLLRQLGKLMKPTGITLVRDGGGKVRRK